MNSHIKIYLDAEPTDFYRNVYPDMCIHECGFSILKSDLVYDNVLFIDINAGSARFISNIHSLDLLFFNGNIELRSLVMHENELFTHEGKVPVLASADSGKIYDLFEEILNEKTDIVCAVTKLNNFFTAMRAELYRLKRLF